MRYIYFVPLYDKTCRIFSVQKDSSFCITVIGFAEIYQFFSPVSKIICLLFSIIIYQYLYSEGPCTNMDVSYTINQCHGR